MVMHARKSHRISDGYFEKHQTHPYQNAKYNNSSSKGNYSERYGHERMRDSPNGNSFRSDSPDSQSPRDRDRAYQKHNSYVHKERENNRLRDKYSTDCVNRSPKDQRRRETDHRINHERDGLETLAIHPKLVCSQNSRDRDSQQSRSNKCVNSSSTSSCDKQRTSGEERVTRIGDWSEHISSSGKKYYYNCKTEVSQWEKPKEWIIRLSHHMSYSTPSKNSSAHPHEKHSTPSPAVSSSTTSSTRVLLNRTAPSTSSNNDLHTKTAPSRPPSYWNHAGSEAVEKPVSLPAGTMQQQDSEPSNSTPESSTSGGTVPCEQTVPAANSTSVLRLGGPVQNKLGNSSNSTSVVDCHQQTPSPNQHQLSPTLKPVSSAAAVVPSSICNELRVDIGVASASADPGPPTPTHSETIPCTTALTAPTQPLPLQHMQDMRKLTSSPGASSSQAGSSTPASSLSCLLTSSVRPPASSVNPALANHYRDDLTSHVRGWPADVCEKQATKMAEESNHSSMHLCRVSAELKSARAIVRNSEIQATIQEQRILFLRQQIQRLEEMKSQNSYMSATEENLPVVLPPTVTRVKK